MNRIFYLILFSMPLVLAAQKVGIGTASPTEKLEVNGNILMDTAKLNAIQLSPNAGAGKILTSDNAGNASWENLVAPPDGDTDDNIGYGVWGDCATNGNITAYQPVVDTAASHDKWFGCAVSISGDYAAVGSSKDNIGIHEQGSVSIFLYNGTKWELVQKLMDPDAGIDDHFGTKVSMSNEYLMVSSPDDDDTYPGQGSVSFFHFNGSGWDFMEKIFEQNPQTNQNFGFDISLAGLNAIVGSPLDNFDRGSASVYQFDGTQWQLINQIEDPAGLPSDLFGASVSIADEWAVIGAFGDKFMNNNNQGSACVFHFDGASWIFMQKLYENLGGAEDQFGTSVAISGDDIMVGIPGDDGESVNRGSVNLYQREGSLWIFRKNLFNYTGSANGAFGFTMMMSGPYALVSAPYERPPGIIYPFGSVSIFQKVGNGWQKFQTVFDPGGSVEVFGFSVGLDGLAGHFAAGVPYYATVSGKVVFGKIK